ncbi:MAG: LytTR family DNA-binding domain-containing protein [Salibacteraceae bacterium]
MKPIKALVVDDEELARKNLEILLEDYCPQVEVVGHASSAEDARKFLASNDIDLMLLDIEMPNGSGFDLLESIADEIDFKIVFVTAYQEYALKAFKFSAVDYILKPIDPEELQRAISKVHADDESENIRKVKVLMHNARNSGREIEKIALPSMEGLRFVNLDEIIYCESQDNYTLFYLTTDERVMVSKTIKHFEEMLCQSHFFRVHRSNIINLHYIDKYVKGEGGYVVMKQGQRIPVSRRRKESFLQLFQLQS